MYEGQSISNASYFFLVKKLADFNEARLHEATWNIYTHALIFPRLSITLFDGKKHLNEVVISDIVGFSL